MEGKRLPLKVQSQWENAAGPLSPMDRLNAAFETIPVSDFPLLALGSVIEVKSDASLEEALEILGKHRIYSAPVPDVQAAADSSWMEKYLGMIDFAGIVHWLLKQVIYLRHKSDMACLKSGDISSLGGDVFVEMKASETYKKAKVSHIAGSFRWAPFISVQPTDSLLTVLLLLSKYRMKSLPVVESGKGSIFNFITQGDVTHMLVQCSGLSWFDKLGKSSLSQLGLPKARDRKMLEVEESLHVVAAFELMNRNGVGGIPVVADGTRKVIGNISASDVSFLLTVPEIFQHDSPLTAGKFLASVRKYLIEKKEKSPLLRPVLTCQPTETLKASIAKLDRAKVHRIYVVDENEDLIGVITLRDIISTFVEEPAGYFGTFFDGVVPASPRYPVPDIHLS
ncbi:hypothetical protein R1flu_007691 [Riccia fluitans]|uniref:CBS domain-containing protein n=1 Tax=Riccia fluitans TaxID=41844 RepID=A0ABD1YZK6_9MARC